MHTTKLAAMARLSLCAAVPMIAACNASDPNNWETDFRLNMVEASVNRLESRDFERIAREDYNAFLKPGEKGFDVIETSLGSIAVAIEDVQPYANGSRLTLHLGNPLAANISELKADVSWGTVNENGVRDKEIGRRDAYTFRDGVPAGTWLVHELTVPDLPPSKIGYVEIENVTFSRIQMPTIRRAPTEE